MTQCQNVPMNVITDDDVLVAHTVAATVADGEAADDDDVLVDDLLVEEISIDGMCGVY
jgi:mycofactocin precursor